MQRRAADWELAKAFPAGNFCGLDYSYQLLRQAYDYWLAGKALELDWQTAALKLSNYLANLYQIYNLA